MASSTSKSDALPIISSEDGSIISGPPKPKPTTPTTPTSTAIAKTPSTRKCVIQPFNFKSKKEVNAAMTEIGCSAFTLSRMNQTAIQATRDAETHEIKEDTSTLLAMMTVLLAETTGIDQTVLAARVKAEKEASAERVRQQAFEEVTTVINLSAARNEARHRTGCIRQSLPPSTNK